jgi:hypothetical protein
MVSVLCIALPERHLLGLQRGEPEVVSQSGFLMIKKGFGNSAIVQEFRVFRVPRIGKFNEMEYEKDGNSTEK